MTTTTIDNIFFLDKPVKTVLNEIRNGKPKKSKVMQAGDSFIATLNQDNERSTLIFRPISGNFTYEVNGHFYGTFFFDDEKIVAKWPKYLRQREKRLVINELQEFFRKYL